MTGMRTSLNGRKFLAIEEGIVLGDYVDSVGVRTCGVGHTAAAGPPKPVEGMVLTLDEAMRIFADDLAKYEQAVNAAIKVPLAQHQFDALVSWHFNTGAVGHATLVKNINAGKIDLAGKEFMDWNKPKEILGRRRGEQRLFQTGDYGDISRAPCYDRNRRNFRRIPWPDSMQGDEPPAPLPVPPDVPIQPPAPPPNVEPVTATPNLFVALFASIARWFSGGKA